MSADERHGLALMRQLLRRLRYENDDVRPTNPQRRPPPAHRLLHLPSSPPLIGAMQHRGLPACFTQSHSAAWAGPRPDAPDSDTVPTDAEQGDDGSGRQL